MSFSRTPRRRAFSGSEKGVVVPYDPENRFQDEASLSVTEAGLNFERSFRIFLVALLLVGSVSLASVGTLFLVKYLRGTNTDGNEKPILRFNEVNGKYTFKIAQLADLHFGHSRESDFRTWHMLDSIIELEAPDLLVLSGDQLSLAEGASVEDEYRIMAERLSKYQIPWASVFGASDDVSSDSLPDANSKGGQVRENLLNVDMEFRHSLSQRGPEEIFGVTNYILDVHIEKTPKANIYFFDTGGGSLPMALLQDQVGWFYESSQYLPAVAFQHFPPLEIRHKSKCVGSNEESMSPLMNDAGIVNAMSESGRVYFLSTGGSHGNDYCCPYSNSMQLCFGRHTGYAEDGDWERGIRLFELEITDLTHRNRMDWRSWVRLESGEVIDKVSRSDMMESSSRHRL